MVSPLVAADENWKVAEGRFCSPGDHLSTFNNYWDASRQISREGHIDLVKVDIGGLGQEIIRSIDSELYPAISKIIYETNIAGKVATLTPKDSGIPKEKV
jgi:hypothetical protein